MYIIPGFLSPGVSDTDTHTYHKGSSSDKLADVIQSLTDKIGIGGEILIGMKQYHTYYTKSLQTVDFWLPAGVDFFVGKTFFKSHIVDSPLRNNILIE